MKNRLKEIDKNIYLEPLITIIFWILLFLSPLIFGDHTYGIDWTHIYDIWLSFIPYLGLYLINRFILLPYLFFKKNKAAYFSTTIILIIMLSVGVHYLNINNTMNFPLENRGFKEGPPGDMQRPPMPIQAPNGIQPSMRNQPPDMHRPPGKQLPPFLSFFIISVLIIGFDTGLSISMRWSQSEKLRIKAEKKNVETQLAFLKNQVSPHFFMNTLNNIHALIDTDVEGAKESIIQLSKLMRHLLYDSEEKKIPIRKEFDFITNYVDLMRLRFSEKVNISLELPTDPPNKTIPPLLFTSYLENAFKHGISYQKKSFINISIDCSENQLIFKIRNSKSKIHSSEGPSGIGVLNSRKRLDLVYGNKYDLNIRENDDEYIVSLNIPL